MIYSHRWFTRVWGIKIIICGGDFNCVDNKNIDKVGGNDAYSDVESSVLIVYEIILSCSLDAYAYGVVRARNCMYVNVYWPRVSGSQPFDGLRT